MTHPGIAAAALALLALALAPAAAAAQEDESQGDRPRLRAHRVTETIRLDGVLSEAAWSHADAIVDLVTVEPEEGGVPAGRTIVQVLVNASELIIGIACYDTSAQGIVAYSMARDAELDEEDHVVLVFDTFQDGRSGYVFAVNSIGSRFDGLVIEQGEEINSDWDAIWEAATSRDAAGWYAEIRIPIKSLSFKKGLDAWGFNVQRRVQRLQEISRWSEPSQDFEVMQTVRAGLLTNLPDFELGMGLSVRPSVVGRTGKPEPGAEQDFNGDVSLDVTQKIGPNILTALTVNTDFAETEVDVRQINLTRFDLFFPEKRSFFLEGSDIFEFGLGLDEDNLLPFFSRRIGLLGLGGSDQLEIPINAGAKVNGRVGETNIGALVVNTRTTDSLEIDDGVFLDVPSRTMGAVRVKQNVLSESSVGMLATFGDQAGRGGSWSTGVDLTYRTSEFGDEQNLLFGVWGVINGRDDLEGDRTAYGIRFDYPNDLVDITLQTIHVGEAFDPSLGFVPRNGVQIWSVSGQYNPRPSWSLVRQMMHEVGFTLYHGLETSQWESYAGEFIPIDWRLESGERITAEFLPQGDRPPEEFEISDEVIVPAGKYQWARYGFRVRAAEKRRVSGELRLEVGDYYNGNLTTWEGRLSVRPSAFFQLEFTGERSRGTVLAIEDSVTLADMDFTEELFGLRVLLNFSPNLQLSSLTQYDTQSKELGSNNKLRWTFNPFGELFVVYNHNLQRTDTNRWAFVSNQLPIKVQYTWRF